MNLKEKYNFRNEIDILNAIKVIKYNSDTGEITRNDRKNSNGSIDKYGYKIIKIKGVQWKAHRLAWAYYYKKSPKGLIDHINRNKLDNRICNLRDVNCKENILNRKMYVNKDTKCIGIYLDKTNGLKANYATKIDGKMYRFKKIEDAKNLRKQRGLKV